MTQQLVAVCLIGLRALVMLSAAAGAARASGGDGTLGIGQRIERQLDEKESHRYQLPLARGQYVHLVVEQHGLDVILTLFAPGGGKLAEIDTPTFTQGTEELRYVAEVEGTYELEVLCQLKDLVAGPYVLRVAALRNADPVDRIRARAAKSQEEADHLRRRGGEENLRRSIVLLEDALRDWQAAGEVAAQAHTLNLLGWQDTRLGAHEKALERYRDSLALWRKVGDLGGQARVLDDIGIIYGKLGDNEKSIEYFEQSLALWQQAGQDYWAAQALNDIGLVQLKTGENERARSSFERALEIRRRLGDRRSLSNTLNSLAIMALALGDYQKALDLLLESVKLTETVGDHYGAGYALNHLGQTYAVLGDDDQALELLERALIERRVADDARGEAQTLIDIGDLLVRRGEQRRALELFQQASTRARARDDRQHVERALMRIGTVFSALGDHATALDSYRESIAIAQRIGDPRDEATTRIRLASAQLARSELAEARTHCDQALKLARAVKSVPLETEALVALAGVERDAGNLDLARRHIEAAAALIESQRRALVVPDLRSSFFARAHGPYELYIDLLMALARAHPGEGYAAAALEASERARSRVLLELLTEARADIRRGVDSELLERERRVRQRLNDKAERQVQLLSGKHAPGEAAVLARDIESLRQQFLGVEAQIRETSPRYAALTQPAPLRLGDIQRLLDSDTSLVEYALGASRSHAWVVTSTSLESFELPGRQTIETAARKLHHVLATRDDAHYRREANALSKMVLGPLARHLRGRRLAIVPSESLDYIPFAALPDPNAGGTFAPLALEHEIISLPSASVLAVVRQDAQRRRPPTGGIAVLADPVFSANDARVGHASRASGTSVAASNKSIYDTSGTNGIPIAAANSADVLLAKSAGGSSVLAQNLARAVRGSLGEGIPRLFHTRREAERIAALAPGASLALDFDASRQTLADLAHVSHRVVHLATHGVLNSEHPELSAVLLSMVDANGNPQNGFLGLTDIYNSELSCELAVLSACQTALGKQVQGEGLIGLVRGFMYAGAPRVLATLWKVDDVATAELMARFYEGLLVRGLSPSSALRSAQASMWKQARWRSPFYWASFVMHGDWQPPQPPQIGAKSP